MMMAHSETPHSYINFDNYYFRNDGMLFKENAEQYLPPKEARVLDVLLQNAGHIVTKDELIETVWRAPVSDESLTRTIYTLRRFLDSNDASRYIETIYGRGYRFKVNVTNKVSIDNKVKKKNVAIFPFTKNHSSIKDYVFHHCLVQSVLKNAGQDAKIIAASITQNCDNMSSIKKLVDDLNINYYIRGCIYNSNAEYTLFAELVDAKTHRLINLESTAQRSTNDISMMLTKMIDEVAVRHIH